MKPTSYVAMAALVYLLGLIGRFDASAQVFPERDACLPTTSARSRDANCARCPSGLLSVRPSFLALIDKVRNRDAVFDDIDRRIDSASASQEVNQLLKGRALARALYGSDADFIASGHASRCLPANDEAAVSAATPFPCENIPRHGLGVIVTAGQSNISNTGSPDRSTGRLYQPSHIFYNYNYLDGKCYIARNPLLGTAGAGENVAVRLGDELMTRKLYQNVLIAPVAIGGTYLEEWRPRGGKYFEILLLTIAGLRDVKLEPTAILWHQGEFNAFAFATGGAEDGTILNVTESFPVRTQTGSRRGIGRTAAIWPTQAPSNTQECGRISWKPRRLQENPDNRLNPATSVSNETDAPRALDAQAAFASPTSAQMFTSACTRYSISASV